MNIMLKLFARDDEMVVEIYDRPGQPNVRGGECWAEVTAPTVEEALEQAMTYLHSEWPRRMFK